MYYETHKETAPKCVVFMLFKYYLELCMYIQRYSKHHLKLHIVLVLLPKKQNRNEIVGFTGVLVNAKYFALLNRKLDEMSIFPAKRENAGDGRCTKREYVSVG